MCVSVCVQEKEGRKRRPTVSMEEREVSRLEKLLKMKKRKTLPTSFRDDGLDCIPATCTGSLPF